MKKISIEEEIDIIKRNAVDLLPEEELREKLRKARREGKPIIVKYGADPSKPDLHLGHYVCLRKLKELQELGHKIVFIVGDFTAMIGDPSGRTSTRPRLKEKEVKENARTYFEQVYKVLDREKTKVVYNSQWLSSLSLTDIIELASTYTVARMLERDDFNYRFKSEIPISIHEFLYPLLQGYDSYAIKADIEVGGTDQKFNFLVAREIQKSLGQEPQVILTLPLLEGTDGRLKMSKSYNNYIGITEPPKEMYGKIMSIQDELVPKYYKLLILNKDYEIASVEEEMKRNPRDVKAKLAFEVVKIFHGEEEARKAEEEFVRIFREKKAPQDIETFEVPREGMSILDLLVKSKLVKSRSEARRLLRQNAIKLNGEKLTDEKKIILVDESSKVLKVGKRRFLKLIGKKN